MRSSLLAAMVAAALLLTASRPAGADTGDLLQTDTLGTSLWSHNFTTHKTSDIGSEFILSEFVGLHYFVSDTVRVGMNLQFGELVSPAPAAGESRFQIFALLPQIGWTFYRPFFVAAVPTIVLRTGGKNQLDLGIQGVAGMSLPLGHGVSASLALEVPYYFKLARRIGITPLAGVAFRF